ncbi:Hypothetical protein PAU_02423 [Photorhabdus asymbiotica]|uniref:Uncharacterized protein n=1 Tax=Photorhabdus asymbiotica subsp. asymbiotica (strain ATCC 43949 / 3105-77) TaxID=553480 RepID=B6VL54_PHOAA|nr:Hypothetical protein PAU_02423 [Photorhabdus asymbiotica]CAR66884.1 Hypothetical protein PA-RVA6-3055 [Photorhabdus asymbiotica subsp. asymbiotica ATCC 43949]
MFYVAGAGKHFLAPQNQYLSYIIFIYGYIEPKSIKIDIDNASYF